MQEYASTSQLHLSKPSCHDSKSFFKPPPQNPTCKSIPQLHSFTSPSLLVTSPIHFLNLPPKPYMQEYASTSQLHLSKPSCHDSKSFFKPSPQDPTCKSMPQPLSFTSPSLLVTSPIHFFNLPPKTIHARVCLNFTDSPLQEFLSRFHVIF